MVLLDEPAAGLNSGEKDQFKDILRKVKDRGITVLLVEHDMGVVMDISDTITVMNFGHKIAEGTPREVSETRTSSKHTWGSTDAEHRGSSRQLWPHRGSARHFHRGRDF